MIDRRSFLKTAVLGGAAFGVGWKLGGSGAGTGVQAGTGASGQRVVLHGFLPADEQLLGEALKVFLALEDGRLPVPTLDAAPAWRATAAGALHTGADRYAYDARRLFSVQVTPIDESLSADLMLQQGGRVLDPSSSFGGGLLRLRERIAGTQARVMVSCRLEDRPMTWNGRRVLIVENENGIQDRIVMDGHRRSLDLIGPAGRTTLTLDQRGAHVAASSCRHATCRRQGVITQPGELLACAPNRIVLRVETA